MGAQAREKNAHAIKRSPGERELSRHVKDVLKQIDKQGSALLKSGAQWEDGMLDFTLPAGAATQGELQMIHDWISAWRSRIIEANGLKSETGN